MSDILSGIVIAKAVILSTLIYSIFAANAASAQSTQIDSNRPQSGTNAQPLSTRPMPENPPDLDRPPKTIHRTGTAIGARNSISIKSTDAGIIHRQPASSGCINCGIINSVNKIGQESSLNAIANGVVAGTVAREVLRHSPYPYGTNHSHATGSPHAPVGAHAVNPGNQYSVGVTMNDGSQTIITLPDASNFQQGDRVQLIDGMLVLDR